MKTSKSNLMHELEKGATTADSVSIPFVPIFDGIALVWIINCSCLTDNEFADDILKFAVARSFGCWVRRDRVWRVLENSTKNAERGNHSTGKLPFKTVVLVNYASKLLLAHLRVCNGVPFSQMETIKQSWFDFWCQDGKDKVTTSYPYRK